MRVAALLLALAAPMMAAAQAASGPSSLGPSLLAPMRDHARPVLIFAGPNDRRVQQQYAELLHHAAELQDRQMRIILVTKSSVTDDAHTPAGTVAATEPEADALRTRFHVERNAFAVLLVGKDGGEKYRSLQPVPFQTLRALVDAMPMRQAEMHVR